MIDHTFLTEFLDPAQSILRVQRLRLAWQEEQVSDLMAVLALLAEHPDQHVRQCGTQWLDTLLSMPGESQRWLVTIPAMPSWQRLASFIAARNERAAQLVAGTSFRLGDVERFMLATGVTVREPITMRARLSPGERLNLPGTGLSVFTEEASDLTWNGNVLTFHRPSSTEDVTLGDLLPAKSPWGEPVRCGPGWAVWQHPLLYDRLEVEPRDTYLTRPFEGDVNFPVPSPDEARSMFAVLKTALSLLEQVWPEMLEEILVVDRQLLWVTNLRQPDEVNSFSDNSVPGALYFSITDSKGTLMPEDVLDSLVHEHLHQKLYLLEASSPLYDPMRDRTFSSPWREDPRPIGGVFHGYFVFHGLASLWKRGEKVPGMRNYAQRRLTQIGHQLQIARQTLSDHARFTPSGEQLFTIMGEYQL